MKYRFKGSPSPHFHGDSGVPLVLGQEVDSDVDESANHPDRFEKVDGTPVRADLPVREPKKTKDKEEEKLKASEA